LLVADAKTLADGSSADELATLPARQSLSPWAKFERMTSSFPIHVPVLPREVLETLDPQPGQILVDGTAGGGGHLRMLAERVAPGGWVLGIDRDPAAIQRLESQLVGLPVQLYCGSYLELPAVLAELEQPQIDGILLDLGLSSDQLADAERGFSFNIDGPLDLRFNPLAGEPAWRLLQRIQADHLADLIYRYGEERFSRRIAQAIVQARQAEPIRTTSQLAQIVRRAVPASAKERIDPATRTFQALRIAVNNELDHLERALARLPKSLRIGGRMAVISFHSLEDRLVKEEFNHAERWKRITRKPIRAEDTEVQQNPRSRSAKLRVAQRVA
jgi:16S rRNA (cytosine1402-N4)-methyltransferase